MRSPSLLPGIDVAPASAAAQTYPDKSIRIVAKGGKDLVLRHASKSFED